MNVLLLIILLKTCYSLTIKEKFTGSVEIDSIVYNVIAIPRHAKYAQIDIWANKFNYDSPPLVLFKYDAFPTIHDYDDMFELPQAPFILSLMDGSPTESLLYIGIWGGKLLNSYKYFAGSVEDIVYGIESTIESCDDQLMNGNDCTILDQLAASTSGKIGTYAIETDNPMTFALSIPNGLESVYIQVSLDTNEISQLCSFYLSQSNPENEIVELIAYVYLGNLDEDLDGGSQHFPLSLEYICKNNLYVDLVKKPIINLNLMLPIAGTWRVTLLLYQATTFTSENTQRRMTLLNIDNKKSRSKLRILEESKSRVFEQSMTSTKNGLVKSLHVIFNVTLSTCNADYIGISDMYEIIKYLEYTNTSFDNEVISVNSETQSIESTCIMRLNPLTNIRSSESPSKGYLTLKSESVLLGYDWIEESIKIDNYTTIIQTTKMKTTFKNKLKTTQPYAVFAARMDHVMIPAMGGALQIQLLVHPNVNRSGLPVLKELNELHFRLSLRFGARPIDPDNEKLDDQIIPANSFTLSSKDALAHRLKEKNYDDDDDNSKGDNDVDGMLYTWNIQKPRLPGLLSTGSNNYLYARITLGRSTVNTSSLSFNISTTLMFKPCTTGSCVHGDCEIQDGYIQPSYCNCKYPFGGERCDELALPYWYFAIQVSCLALSNLAMLPGILFSYFHNMALFSILLTSSATSSALYHLCDTDVYCIGGLSFKSLQITDILFSTVCVATIIMHHSPLSGNTLSALVICIISLLILPISDDPTNPQNIFIAILLSITMCILGWLSAIIIHRFPYLNKRDDTWRFNPGTHFSAAAKGYAPVAVKDTDSIEMQLRDSQDCSHDDEDGFDHSSDEQEDELSQEISTSLSTADMNTSTILSMVDRIRICIKSIPIFRWTALGLVLAFSGVLCFTYQDRLTYWYMHSLWHVLIMSSVLPLLLGRGMLVNKIAFLLYIPIGGNAVMGKAGY